MNALAALMEKACRNGFSIKDAAGDLSAETVDQLSLSLANDLKSRGAVPLEPVIVLIGNRSRDIAGFYAAWRMGMVAVPLHESAPPDVVAQMKNTVGARFIVNNGHLQGSGQCLAGPKIAESTALIIFTSGSTGRPKGVMLGHERLNAKVEALQKLLKFNSTDVVIVPLQLTFVFGLWVSLLALMAGATLKLMPKFSASGMLDQLASRASVIGVVPTMLRSMQLNPPPSSDALRLVLTGGEPFPMALARKVIAAFPRAQIFDLYGSTETGSCDFFLLASDPSTHGTIGQPTNGVGFRIVAQDESDCALSEVGELRIATPYGMLGYFDDPKTTTAVFDGKGYFRTGDLARKRADGVVELAGRQKEIISRGGVKVSPLELDSLFEMHPDVEAALCGGVPDSRLGETIHLLVVTRHGANLDPELLRAWAALKLEKQKLPDAIHFVKTLPLGRTGKADRNGVKNIVLTNNG